jgi:O-acetyl-ADP-ribose deacetylase (regulator of RNase III)
MISNIVNEYNIINAKSYKLDRKSIDIHIIESFYTPDNLTDKINKLLKFELEEKYNNNYIIHYKKLDQKKFINVENSKIYLIQCDITLLEVECIVNAANTQGLGCFNPEHNCIDNIIHRKSGPSLRKECFEILHKRKNSPKIINPGEAIITNTYNLPCSYIIHTVGPNITESNDMVMVITDIHCEKLSNCYINILELCKLNKINSVAIPNISTGLYGFDAGLASVIALDTVKKWLIINKDYQIDIIFVCWTQENYNLYLKYF